MRASRQKAESGASIRKRLTYAFILNIIPLILLTFVAAGALQTVVSLSETNIRVGQTEVLPALHLESHINGAAGLSLLTGAPGSLEAYVSYNASINSEFRSLRKQLDPISVTLLDNAYQQWSLDLKEIAHWESLPVAQRVSTAMATQGYFIPHIVSSRHFLSSIANREAQLNGVRLHRQEEVRSTILALLGLACLASIVGSLFVAWRLGCAVITPLSEIEQGLDRLGNGELSYRLPAQSSDEFGAVSMAVNVMASQLEHQQFELLDHALHDPLTGLPNRWFLSQEMAKLLAGAKSEGQSLAILILDLNRFKEINDTLGHYCGDVLLREVGPRIREVIRASDLVARLGGDEFAVLISGTGLTFDESRAMFMLFAKRINEALAKPFLVEDMLLAVDASVGLAVFPDDGETSELLLQRADIAMYVAKRTQAGPVFYDVSVDKHNPDKLALLSRLRQAINTGELVVHYQPIINLFGGAVAGAEALVRWQHPDKGLIGPIEFISLAESSGDIRQLTAYVLSTALDQCRRWRENGDSLIVSVNVSARLLLDAELPDLVGNALIKAKVPGTMLKLEITESAIIADPPRALEILSKLGQLGVCISVDDFGTGYSSIAYLRDLPVQELKIDRSFVARMLHDERDVTIVRTSIELAHRLGITVVAEGVESREVHQCLRDLLGDYGQGYFYSPALPADTFNTWLEGWKSTTRYSPFLAK